MKSPASWYNRILEILTQPTGAAHWLTMSYQVSIEVLILWRIICQLYLKKNMFKNSLKNLAQFFYQEALKLAFFVEDTKSDFSLY